MVTKDKGNSAADTAYKPDKKPPKDVSPPPDKKPPPDAPSGPDKWVCGPANCAGCCLANNTCGPGTSDTACGVGGVACSNCATFSQVCKSGFCTTCQPDCTNKKCGASDGCGGKCAGTCPQWEKCSSKYKCECGSYPHYKRVSGVCLPSCGNFLKAKSLPDAGGGCCSSGCKSGTYGGGPNATHDCVYCCSSTVKGVTSCK